MKRTLTLLFVSLLFSTGSFAQGEADKWFFGTFAGLDFSSGAPVVVSGSTMTTSEGTAAISDASGNLKFYTNGDDVYDASHTLMPNGSGLLGDVSTTQSAIVVPSPTSASRYYLFTAGPDGAGDFGYSEVDMTLNSGMGDIVLATKNTVLMDSTTEKIAAIRDEGNGTWIVTHKFGTNEFYAYHLTTSGLMPPVISSVGSVHNASVIQNSYGQLKFNNCGTRLACAVGYQDIVELFDFSLSTGVVSNPMTINMGDNVYGVEFSGNGNMLYVSSYDVSCKLAQFNISLATLPLILASKTPLSVTDDLYALQLAPDGKIYVSRSFSSQYLGVIDSPNTPGSGCAYNDFGIDLDPSFMGVNGALGLPAFMQTYIKVALGATCLTTDIADPDPRVLFPVYPNPSTGAFGLNLPEIANVVIYDHTGRLVERFEKQKSTLKFGEKYPPGIYLVNVITEQGNSTQKIIRQ